MRHKATYDGQRQIQGRVQTRVACQNFRRYGTIMGCHTLMQTGMQVILEGFASQLVAISCASEFTSYSSD